MKLTYIYHSCFMLEGEQCDLIIDYFHDSKSEREGIVHQRVLDNSKKLYFLATHSHPDHFNPQILKWKATNSNIEYIFSKDILEEGFARLEDATYLEKLEIYRNEDLLIKAFGSTDIGISFLIEMDGKSIFHAGDLNNWHWNEESTQQESYEFEINYLDELELLHQHVSSFDIVMFPVDARLGKDYMRGAEQFVSKMQTKLFVPMHFGEAYNKAAAIESFAKSKNCTTFAPSFRGDSIVISN